MAARKKKKTVRRKKATREILCVGSKVNGVHTYEMASVAPAATVPALFQMASVRRFDITDLAVHAPTLEDVFLSITGRSLRD